jgi:acetyl-CoA acyltransferase 1
MTMSSSSTQSEPPSPRFLSLPEPIQLQPKLNNILFQAKKGGFRETHPEMMLSHVLRAVYTQPGLNPALIDDVSVGTVLQPGGGASASRMAALHAGIPYTASLNTVNRQCSSGLTAVNQIANQIMTGQIDIGIGPYIFSYYVDA